MIGSVTLAANLILTRRELLYRTMIGEIRRRYAGSVLGAVWLLLGPLLLMALYAILYGIVFKLKPPELSSTEYIIYILAGMIPFLGFTEALTSGSMSLTTQRDVLLNTVFPAELVPLRAVLVAFVAPMFGMLFLLLAGAVFGKVSLWWLLVPLVFGLLVLFVAGVVWLLSLANLVLRDIQQALTYISMILLVTSPIGYTPSMLPPGFSVLIWLNPLSYFVIALQYLVVFGSVPPLAAAVGCGVLGVGGFTIGWKVFQRAKMVFFDYA
jgi:homopolymeric O-antigen transport system permease protein